MNEAGETGSKVPDYTDENVSTKIIKIIQSYTGIVDKMVWRKNDKTSFISRNLFSRKLK